MFNHIQVQLLKDDVNICKPILYQPHASNQIFVQCHDPTPSSIDAMFLKDIVSRVLRNVAGEEIRFKKIPIGFDIISKYINSLPCTSTLLLWPCAIKGTSMLNSADEILRKINSVPMVRS